MLSLTQIGLIASVVTICSFIAQPIMGLLADRYQPKRFMFAGLILSTIFIPLMAVTPWYWMIILFAGTGALGSSMYHPTAAGLVSEYAKDIAGFGMALFGLGGTLAFSIGPMAITAFIVTFGIGQIPFTSIFGLCAVAAVLFLLPETAAHRKMDKRIFHGFYKRLSSSWKAVIVIWIIASLRSVSDVTLRSFYPIYYMENGNSLIAVGAILSMYMLGSAVSAIVCGTLSDRIGYKPIFYFSFIIATPSILLFLYCHGLWVYPLSFISGFVLLATMFPSVALATKIAPENKSLVASITLGFAVGTGGFLVPLVGRFAEHFGLQTIMITTAFVPLIGLLMIPRIPKLSAVKQ